MGPAATCSKRPSLKGGQCWRFSGSNDLCSLGKRMIAKASEAIISRQMPTCAAVKV